MRRLTKGHVNDKGEGYEPPKRGKRAKQLANKAKRKAAKLRSVKK